MKKPIILYSGTPIANTKSFSDILKALDDEKILYYVIDNEADLIKFLKK